MRILRGWQNNKYLFYKENINNQGNTEQLKGSVPLNRIINYNNKDVDVPRKPRFYLPGVPAHVIQRGNNRQAVFFADEDYSAFLGWLKEGAVKHGCAVHAYVLMTNHMHLLVTPQHRESISQMVQYVGRNYVTYVNHQYGRTNKRGRRDLILTNRQLLVLLP